MPHCQVRTATVLTELHARRSLPATASLCSGAPPTATSRWERADELDITREPKRNLAFGEGIPHCLGAPLARLRGRIVLQETVAALPHYRLDGPVERIATHDTRGVARLAPAIA
jgi:cytochrome P450